MLFLLMSVWQLWHSCFFNTSPFWPHKFSFVVDELSFEMRFVCCPGSDTVAVDVVCGCCVRCADRSRTPSASPQRSTSDSDKHDKDKDTGKDKQNKSRGKQQQTQKEAKEKETKIKRERLQSDVTSQHIEALGKLLSLPGFGNVAHAEKLSVQQVARFAYLAQKDKQSVKAVATDKAKDKGKPKQADKDGDKAMEKESKGKGEKTTDANTQANGAAETQKPVYSGPGVTPDATALPVFSAPLSREQVRSRFP